MNEPVDFSSEQNIAQNQSNKKKANSHKTILIFIVGVLVGAIAATAVAFIINPTIFTHIGDVDNSGAYEQGSEMTTEEGSSVTAEPETTQPAPNQNNTSAVDYSGGWSTEWLCTFDTDDEDMNMLMNIDRVEHGTAGSSLKELIAAVSMLKLSANAEQSAQKVNEYLSKMDATQKDYFSFQWHNSYKEAANMLEAPEQYSGMLLDIGEENFVISNYTSQNLTELNNSVLAALQDAGVRDVWESSFNTEL